VSRADASGLDRITARLQSISSAMRPDAPEMQALAADLVRLVTEGNRKARLAGLDAQGNRLPTPKAPPKRRGGSGPYLAPKGEASGVVARFKATSSSTPAGIAIDAGWTGADWLRYYPAVTKGLDPETRAAVEQRIARFRREVTRAG
jgi:hypothetical protein